MTGVRQSFVFCREKNGFDTGKATTDQWIAPPPGSFLSTTHTRSVTKVYTEGSKHFDTLAYGQLNGSWEWTFTMDYDYLEPFLLAFEDQTISGDTITFGKSNSKRVPSFCIMRRVLNRLTDGVWESGLSDETVVLTGCVVKTIRFSKSAGASQISVSMNGFYADEHMVLSSSDLAPLYQDYNGNLVEFECMFVGGVSTDNYVANTESLSVGIENSASAVFTTCTPIASNFSESQTSYSFGTMAYSNDPRRYKQRVYNGGSGSRLYPGHKNMTPIPLITLASYNAEDIEYDDNGGKDIDLASAYKSAGRTATFELDTVAIKSLTWQKGDGSRLQDQINSTDCKTVTLKVKTPVYKAKSISTIDAMWGSSNPHKVTVAALTTAAAQAASQTTE